MIEGFSFPAETPKEQNLHESRESSGANKEAVISAWSALADKYGTHPNKIDHADPEYAQAETLFETWRKDLLATIPAGDSEAERIINLESQMCLVESGFTDPDYLNSIKTRITDDFDTNYNFEIPETEYPPSLQQIKQTYDALTVEIAHAAKEAARGTIPDFETVPHNELEEVLFGFIAEDKTRIKIEEVKIATYLWLKTEVDAINLKATDTEGQAAALLALKEHCFYLLREKTHSYSWFQNIIRVLIEGKDVLFNKAEDAAFLKKVRRHIK